MHKNAKFGLLLAFCYQNEHFLTSHDKVGNICPCSMASTVICIRRIQPGKYLRNPVPKILYQPKCSTFEVLALNCH